MKKKKKDKLVLEYLEPRVLLSATPEITISAPAIAMVNNDFNFTINLDNTAQVETGYKPYIDVYVPNNVEIKSVIQGNTNVKIIDLGEFTEAERVKIHPLAKDRLNRNIKVIGSPGEHLYILELPNNGIAPGQPLTPINITANLKDYSPGFTIRAEAGFAYGNDPYDNPWFDPSILGEFKYTTITPTLIQVDRWANTAEHEVTTGEYYVVKYTVQIDIADNYKVSDLTLKDILPDNLHYVPGSFTSSIPYTTLIEPQYLETANNLLVQYNGNITGTAAKDDVTITYKVYIPKLDIHGEEIISNDTAEANEGTTYAIATANYYYNNTLTQVQATSYYTLNEKSIALQQSVELVNDVNNNGYSPQDTLEHRLYFQVSDYFAFNNVYIEDYLSDGLEFDSSYTPHLIIVENGRILNINFDESNVNVIQLSDGRTKIVFDISNQIKNYYGWDSIIKGDQYDDALRQGGTTAFISFRSKIKEQYNVQPVNGSNINVDMGDILTNNAVIKGTLYNNPSKIVEDQADEIRIELARLKGEMNIYAINGDTNYTQNRVELGDKITYRLKFNFPISDSEHFVIEDYLPQSIFNVNEIKRVSLIKSNTPPPPGVIWFSTNSTLDISNTPELKIDPVNNKFTLDFGSIKDSQSKSAQLEILFTVSVKNASFKNNVIFNNTAYAKYINTQRDNFVVTTNTSTELVGNGCGWIYIEIDGEVNTPNIDAEGYFIYCRNQNGDNYLDYDLDIEESNNFNHHNHHGDGHHHRHHHNFNKEYNIDLEVTIKGCMFGKNFDYRLDISSELVFNGHHRGRWNIIEYLGKNSNIFNNISNFYNNYTSLPSYFNTNNFFIES